MAIFASTVTLGASAQSLDPSPTIPKPIVWMAIENEASNAVVYVGKDNTVSSTNYGKTIPASSTVPQIIGCGDNGKFNLQDVWVSGTNGQKIHIFGITQ